MTESENNAAARPTASDPSPPSPGGARDRGPGEPWPVPLRWAFRFIFVYFVLYCFPEPLNLVPGFEPVDSWLNERWRRFIPWVGEHVLHLPERITIFPAGSGDTTFNYVEVLCLVVFAAVGTLAWSGAAMLMPKPPREHHRLHRWFSFYLRWVLGMALISYGVVKVIKLQFPDLDIGRLTQPYGESSPMGLLWTFMGASTPYTCFAGVSEIVPGVLLLFRRTALLGALLGAAVMLNVVLLNFCYDVPVKLYSSHLFIMSCLIALPDAGRLWRVVVLNRPSAPAPERRLFETRRLDLALTGVKALIVVATLWMQFADSIEQRRQMLDTSGQPAIVGTYSVERFSENGVERPMLMSDGTLWKRAALRVVPGGSGGPSENLLFMVRKVGGESLRFAARWDQAAGELRLTPWRGGGPPPDGEPAPAPEVLRCEMNDTRLTMEGTVGGSEVRAEMTRMDGKDFLLLNRGFHWINETPFNR